MKIRGPPTPTSDDPKTDGASNFVGGGLYCNKRCRSSEAIFREAFADFSPDTFDISGHEATPNIAALDAMEQFQPVEERGINQWDPLDIFASALGSFIKLPLRADVLSVNMTFNAIFAGGCPSDFSFGSQVS